MKLLVTRPREQAEELTNKLRTQGIEVWVEPMLRIVRHKSTKLNLSNCRAVLVTSVNGAEALAKATVDRDVKLYAVGDVTAKNLSHHGFHDVRSAGGNADDLAALVEHNVNPGEGPLLHVGGTNSSGRLEKRLCQGGYTVHRVALYGTVRASSFSTELQNAMAHGEIDGVLFFSPETARIFVSLMLGALCEKTLVNMTAFCLSAAVAEAANRVPWGGLVVCDRPNASSLLASVLAAQ